MQHLEVSRAVVLYIGRTVSKGALTSRTPQDHVGLFRGYFTFYFLLVNLSHHSRVPASSSRFVCCRMSISLTTHSFLFSDTPTTLQRTSIFIFEDGNVTQSRNVDNKPPCAAQQPRRAKISNIYCYNTSAQYLLALFLV
jgi:hypothetical protein